MENNWFEVCDLTRLLHMRRRQCVNSLSMWNRRLPSEHWAVANLS